MASTEKSKPSYERLVAQLREMTTLFQFALLNTTPELAKQGMVFVRQTDALIKAADPRS